jgi:hypothetical protein
MRPGDYRLVFNLPPIFALSAQPGRHHPCLDGCLAAITRAGQVEIIGPSRERVFEQAHRLLRIIGRGHEPVSIPAVLTSPSYGHRPGGKDGWSISVNANVSFAPTGLGAEVFGDAA